MVYDKETEAYTDKTKLSNGQTAIIWFSKHIYDNFIDYYVVLAVSNKRKQIQAWKNSLKNNIEGKQTGKDISALIWAKNKIFEFEEYIKDNYRKPVNIVIQWEDTKRKRAYQRLIKYGYKYDTVRNGLFKQVIPC